MGGAFSWNYLLEKSTTIPKQMSVKAIVFGSALTINKKNGNIMRNKKNKPTLENGLELMLIGARITLMCRAKNISNKTAITNKPENTAITPANIPLPHVEKIISFEKEEYNKSSDNILKELGSVALLFAIVLLFLLLLYLALYFSKK